MKPPTNTNHARYSSLHLVVGVIGVSAQNQNSENDEFLRAMSKEIARNGGAVRESAELAFETVFPSNKDHKFLSGELTEVVVGLTSKVAYPVSVFAISGYFANPKNSSKPIHELPAQRFNIKLDTKQEASLPLRFTPELEAQQLVLVVLIDYFDVEETPRRVIVFEGPIQIIPSDSLFDLAGLSVIAAFVGAAYIGYKVLTTKDAKNGSSGGSATSVDGTAPKKVKVSAAEIRAEIEAKKDVLDEEWIPVQLKKKKN
ncbi:hypothetical protein HK100_004065 [Physocladia obscura]|uniref:Translocon-associated protein subunit alpha n=1 Tax=Physocladia obscura TaxID=109957 RepID=A0AAD5XL15_9FUNG|nr:hypothetical protein HK100_004065 [Physocladia obscura]